MRFLLASLVFSLGLITDHAGAQTNLPSAATVSQVIRRANDYWIATFPQGDNGWSSATYYVGNQRIARLLADTNYLSRSVNWASANSWDVPGTDSADSLACGQTYFDLYRMDSQPSRIADLKQRLEATLATGLVDQWQTVEAGFMAAPDFAQLWSLNGDTNYFRKPFLMYDDLKNRRGLFDPVAGLWYRDAASIYPGAQTASGNKVFWAQGNGWMIAALARVLERMPINAAHRAEYVNMLQTMAAALKPLQGADGLWRSSLLEPTQFPNPETSGTALNTYALAWGVRNGILNAADYTNTLARAWHGLTNLALQASGRLGYVQLSSGSPANPGANDTAAHGVGAFLLACSELYLLPANAPAISPWAGADTVVVDKYRNGDELVTLDASGTEIYLGPATYSWFKNGLSLDTGSTTQVLLPVGTNVITLHVTGGNSLTYTASVMHAVIQLPSSNRDYRSVGSGNWNSLAIWQTNNGTAWFPALTPPATADNVVTIRDGDTVTVAAATTNDQVLVELGAQVVVNFGVTWTLNDSVAGTDLTVDGVLTVDGTIAGLSTPQVEVNGAIVNSGTISGLSGSEFAFHANSVYLHTRDGGTIPNATWNTESLCEVNGIALTAPAGLAQTFHHFTWNCPLQEANVTLSSQPTAVNGDFAIYDTGSDGTNAYQLIGVTGNGIWTLDVGGDFILANGTFNFSTGTGGTLAMNLAGTFLQIGGTFTSSNAVSTLTLNFDGPNGAFVLEGGTFTTARIDFNVANDSSLTLYSDLPVASGRTFTVSGTRGTLNCGTNRLTGAGSFTLNAGGTLGLGDAAGITTSPTLSGNIQVTGTRSFASGANYSFSGSAAQVTGTGLPASVNDLAIINEFGVTLSGSRTVNGVLGLWSGALSLGANTLTLNGGMGPNGGGLIGGTSSSLIFGGAGPAAALPGVTLTNLTLNRANGLFLGGNVTLHGTLTLSNGKIMTGTHRVNIVNTSSTAISGATSTRYVNGLLQKAFTTGSQTFTFPIGDLSRYTPISVGAMVVTAAGSLTASTTSTEHPALATSGVDAAKNVNRFWTLTPVGLVASSYNVTNSFASADLDALANTATFVLRRYNGASWFVSSIGARTATSTAAIGLNAFSDYAVGENAIDHYSVAAASPQNVNVPFTVTVTAQDIFNQTVTGDTNTLVLHSGTGSVVFDSNDDGTFGDNAKSLSSGVLSITARDAVAETISITATDANSKSGTLAGLMVLGSVPAGTYRSVASGDWSAAGTWQTNNGAAWFAANAAPTLAANTITISNGHTVTVTASTSVDQILVQAGGRLAINNGQTLTVANGAGADLEVLGAVQNAGTLSPGVGATLSFQSGSKYEHQYTSTAGTIPTALWASGSTCEILGYTSNAATPGGLGQIFSHFTWNCTNQTGTINFGSALTEVSGNFNVVRTGSGSVALSANLVVGGAASVAGESSFNCGPYVLSGASFTLGPGATLGIGSATGIAASGLTGNIHTTARSFSTNASYLYNGTVAQITGSGLPTTVSNLTVANIVGSGTTLTGNVTVKGVCAVNTGAALTLGTAIVNGPGAFLLQASGTLGIGHADGITASGAIGNLQNTGSRTLSSGASFRYLGATAQGTGNGLPASVNNLTIQNPSGVTLNSSPTITGSLALTSGKLTTGTNQINIETAATVTGAGSSAYVVGRLQKAFAAALNQSFTFPVGDAIAYLPVTLSAMDVVTSGTLTLTNTAGDHPGMSTNGLNSLKSVNRYWSFAPGGGLAISSYNVTFDYLASDVDAGANTAAFVVRRFAGGNWFATGTGTRTATNTQAVGVNSFSDFVVAENVVHHFAVTATSPQTATVPFLTTVAAQDLFNQTVAADSSTVVTLSGTGSVQFDANENGTFGDHTRTLTNGAFTMVTRDLVAETVNLTATDGTGKTGTLVGLVIGGTSSVAGDYRSATNGNWATAATWQTNNGTTWFPATTAPAAANAGTILIRSGHTVTVAATATGDQVIVEAGGQLTVASGQTFTIANSVGADLTVFGVLRNAGIISQNSGVILVVEAGGRYQHNYTSTAGTIPTANWASGSTCEIIGYTSSPGGPVGLGQSFHHFIWNCTNQTANLSLSTSFVDVNGDFVVSRTGAAAALYLSVNTASSLDVAGGFTQTGGILKLSGNNAVFAMTVHGSVSLLGGSLEMSGIVGTGAANGNGIGTLNVGGNFLINSGATLTETSPNAGAGQIFFAGTNAQSFTSSGSGTNTVHFTVNDGATLVLGTNLVTGSGNFTNRAGATLALGDPSGITLAGTAAGNIQNTGSRNFNSAASYIFNGVAPQVPGSGLPATVNDLLIANPAGVTLNATVTVTGICSVESGALLLGTGTINGQVVVQPGGTLAPGTSVGTLTINGPLNLAGQLNLELSKTGAALTNDLITGLSALTAGGTLTVTASGDALAANDAFNLFDATTFTGSFTLSLPTLTGCLSWDTSTMLVDGILRVAPCPSWALSGQIELQAYVGSSRLVTFLATGGASNMTWNISLTFTGTPRVASFALPEVPIGTTGLSAKTQWNLRRKLALSFTNAQAVANFIGSSRLLGGDISGNTTNAPPNNSVNLTDYNKFKAYNGRSGAAAVPADITGNGSVNISDFTVLKGNLGKVGDSQ